MKIKEMLTEFYNAEDDELSKRKLSDTRTPTLTLSQIRKLRIMRDTEIMDKKNHLKIVSTIYGGDQPAQ
jgi:hypothetical protein